MPLLSHLILIISLRLGSQVQLYSTTDKDGATQVKFLAKVAPLG